MGIFVIVLDYRKKGKKSMEFVILSRQNLFSLAVESENADIQVVKEKR